MTTSSNIIIKHGSIYFVGNILRHVASFIMLPIYTRVLTPADYGTIELLSMVVDFAGIIFGMRIGEAVFRFYLMTEDDKAKKQVVSTAIYLTVLMAIFGFILISLGSGVISTAVFGSSEYQNLLILFSISLVFQPIIEIPMIYIRAIQRPWLFVIFSTLKLVLQLSLNIYLIVFLGLGVKGVVLSAVISGGIVSLLLSGYCLMQTGISFSISQAKKLIPFSYPMILEGVISFYVTFGDRYFLKLYGTLTDVGIYSLGYKFGFLLAFIGIRPFFSIWDSERYNVLKKQNATAIFQQVFVLFFVFTLCIAIGISIFSKDVLKIMANPEFWGAARIVPVVLLAYFLQGLTGFCNLGILLHKKTIIITKSIMLSAALITVLYLILIPRFGALGAAWATAVTFAVRLVYIYKRSKNLYDMELSWNKLYLILPPSLIVVLTAMAGPNQIFLSISLNVVLFTFFILMLTLLPVLSANQRRLLRSLLLQPWKFKREVNAFFKGS